MIKDGSPSLRLAVVGLGFGAEFVPLYLAHPDVGDVVLVEPDEARRSAVAARYGLARGHGDLDDALASGGFDAVHLLTPVPTHAALTLRCLEAGLHVACAVPMATTSADLDLIIFAAESRGLVYQMMETSVFSREFRFVRSLHQRGSLREAHALQRQPRAESRRLPDVLAGLSAHALFDPCAQSRARTARHRSSGGHRPRVRCAHRGPPNRWVRQPVPGRGRALHAP